MRDYTRVSVISKYMIILLECFSIYRVIQNTFNNSCFNLNFRSDEEIVMRIGNLTLSPIPPPPNSYIIKSSTIVHCNKTCIGFLGAKGPLQIIYTLCTSVCSCDNPLVLPLFLLSCEGQRTILPATAAREFL